ncbi:MAG: CHAT domain-containing protein [Pseudonocardia sp.]
MRDRLLAAVKAQLERIAAEEVPARALMWGARRGARRLARMLRNDDSDLETLYALGWFHWYRYLALPECMGRKALKEAVRTLTPCFIASAEALPEPLLPVLVENACDTALAWIEQATRTNDAILMTAAVSLWQRILNTTPADDPDQASYLSNLGVALRARFELVGVQADLDGAISVGREAVQASPVDHPDRAAMLSNLGGALQARFELIGVQADLDEAITLERQAVQASPGDHPDRAGHLSNLGLALLARFGRVGVQADLVEAISVGREAVQASPVDHPYRAMYLSNLGGFLQARFERVGVQADLVEAISVGREAVQASPVDHPDRAAMLSNLGGSLLARFGRVGVQAGLADLDEAITVGREAVQASPVDHPDRAMYLSYLSNLGGSLQVRFRRVGVQADLDEAITVGRQAVQASPVDHPDRAMSLSNLGLALQVRFERVGVQADLDEAITVGCQAVEVVSGAPSVRIRAAWSATSLAARTGTGGVADLLETAVRLLPETVSRRLDRGDQQYALGQFAGLASDAAALALADEFAGTGEEPAVRALQLLELGRGILLSQALDTRSDLTDLHVHHPALAERFVELRDQLDHSGDIPALIGGPDMAAGPQRRGADRHQLAAAFEATVTAIRELDGFATFLLPPEPDQLIHHASRGPVVVVNVSQYRSDALLLTLDGITSVPLPDLTQQSVIDQVVSFHQALDTVHDPDVGTDERVGAQDTLSVALEWLWDVAARPILDHLGYRHTPPLGTVWPRLWWASGGFLSFLPLHAAGYHREPLGPDGGRRTVMDRVVSSYTPTVRALGYARERDTSSTAVGSALIVAMPTTPGIDSPLRHVAAEAALVHIRFPGSTLLIEKPAVTTGHPPIKANVLDHLSRCAVAHFACHGNNHPSDPSQSLLLLHDHDTDPLTVASLAPVRLDHARLAYLSACRTAFNPSTELIDEAIHLTTAFQLAGYPHVVGTLWEINDALAVRVADSFYTALTTDSGTIDTTGAARALHQAVRAIRDQLPATPSLWAAYLHAGA